MSLATAEPMRKMLVPNIPTISGHDRPMSSDAGAQITGPDAKPRTKREVPKSPISALTPRLELAAAAPGAKTALANEAWKVPKQTMNDTKSLDSRVVCQCIFLPEPG